MIGILGQLVLQFMRVGLFSVGGGLATLPFLREMGVHTGWFTTHDISNMIAISQSTPGPIGVNMAVYAGYKVAGITGAIIAPIGLILPPVIIVIAISHAMRRFKESHIVQAIFYGLRPASAGLILSAGLSVATLTFLNKVNWHYHFLQLFNYKAILLALIIFGITRVRKIHPIVLILLSAIVGIIFKF